MEVILVCGRWGKAPVMIKWWIVGRQRWVKGLAVGLECAARTAHDNYCSAGRVLCHRIAPSATLPLEKCTGVYARDTKLEMAAQRDGRWGGVARERPCSVFQKKQSAEKVCRVDTEDDIIEFKQRAKRVGVEIIVAASKDEKLK